MLGYFFGVITAFTAVVALAVGLFNITSKWASSTPPSCNRSDSYGRDTTALTGRERRSASKIRRERGIASKRCLSGRCHCKSGN